MLNINYGMVQKIGTLTSDDGTKVTLYRKVYTIYFSQMSQNTDYIHTDSFLKGKPNIHIERAYITFTNNNFRVPIGKYFHCMVNTSGEIICNQMFTSSNPDTLCVVWVNFTD